MARIRTGEYRVWFFDAYGERQKPMDLDTISFTDSVKQGDDTIRDPNNNAASFMIIRGIYNSLDPRYKT